MRAYSMDLRERVLAAVDRGTPRKEIVHTLGVSEPTIRRYLRLRPIEEAFSKIKAILRSIEARTQEALVEAIGQALDAVSPRDALGWFAHCGYRFTDQPT